MTQRPVAPFRELKAVASLSVEYCAQHAAGVADAEGDNLWCGQGSSEDQIAFILAVGIVDDDNWTPVSDLLDRMFHGGEPGEEVV
jgi:hypothetical protein